MAGKGFDKVRLSCEKQIDGLRNGGGPLLLTIILTFLVMLAVCVGVFFASVQGKEQVMVPNVIGKDLTTALLELQTRELYGKIQLRYSDLPGRENTILEQEPKAGAIVKAYQRVTITVDRGVALDRLEDYTGRDITEVRTRLQLLFSGESGGVSVASPVYTKSSAQAGTIIAQYPQAGEAVSAPMTIRFVVSSGDKDEAVTVPDLKGLTVQQVLRQLEGAKVVFDFSSHAAGADEKPGSVTSQQKAGEEVVAFSRISADFAFPAPDGQEQNVSAIFSYDAPQYPYAVPMQLDARDDDGNTVPLVQFSHPGGAVTVPYTVKHGTTLILSILGEEKHRTIVP